MGDVLLLRCTTWHWCSVRFPVLCCLTWMIRKKKILKTLTLYRTCTGSEMWWPRCSRPGVGRSRSRPTDLPFLCTCLPRRGRQRSRAVRQTCRCPCPFSKCGHTWICPRSACCGQPSGRWRGSLATRCSATPADRRTRTWTGPRGQPAWEHGPEFGSRTPSVWSGPRTFAVRENRSTLRGAHKLLAWCVRHENNQYVTTRTGSISTSSSVKYYVYPNTPPR